MTMALGTAHFLEIEFFEDIPKELTTIPEFKKLLPFSKSELHKVNIKYYKLLTKGEDVKKIYDIALNTEGIKHDFFPGDTVGILPRNNKNEVELLMKRLKIDEVCNKVYKLQVRTDTTKKNACIPNYIPPSGTLIKLFTEHISIRSIWKKLFLKSLLAYTTNDEDREKLEEICNTKNVGKYIDFVTNEGHTLVGLLNSLPSCNPPIDKLLEHLPPLQPRYYSIASSPLLKNEIHLTFSLLEAKDGNKGVCTGYLENCLDSKGDKISFYFRKSADFLSNIDANVPTILIGPGTGIAPYIGFLQDRTFQNDVQYSGSTVYYGCRYEERDYIYRNEMDVYKKSALITTLRVAFSRMQESKVYVQDKILEDAENIVDIILNKNAFIRVCGGGLEFGRTIEDTIIKALIKFSNKSEEEAINTMKELHNENRLKMDTWL